MGEGVGKDWSVLEWWESDPILTSPLKKTIGGVQCIMFIYFSRNFPFIPSSICFPAASLNLSHILKAAEVSLVNLFMLFVLFILFEAVTVYKEQNALYCMSVMILTLKCVLSPQNGAEVRYDKI